MISSMPLLRLSDSRKPEKGSGDSKEREMMIVKMKSSFRLSANFKFTLLIFFSLGIFGPFGLRAKAERSEMIGEATPPATCCICYYDNFDSAAEQAIYRIGCAREVIDCDYSEVRPLYPSHDLRVCAPVEGCPAGSHYKTSYIGHWESEWTRDFVIQQYKLCLDSKCCSFESTNTGCDSCYTLMDETAQEAFDRILEERPLDPGQVFKYTGTQCTSFGGWAEALGCESTQAYCSITLTCDSRTEEFPPCDDLEREICIEAGETAQCMDRGTMREVRCCPSGILNTWKYGTVGNCEEIDITRVPCASGCCGCGSSNSQECKYCTDRIGIHGLGEESPGSKASITLRKYNLQANCEGEIVGCTQGWEVTRELPQTTICGEWRGDGPPGSTDFVRKDCDGDQWQWNVPGFNTDLVEVVFQGGCEGPPHVELPSPEINKTCTSYKETIYCEGEQVDTVEIEVQVKDISTCESNGLQADFSHL